MAGSNTGSMASSLPLRHCLAGSNRAARRLACRSTAGNRETLAQDFYGLSMDNGWLGAVEYHAEVPARNENVTSQVSRDIFSSMVYENICPGEYECYFPQQYPAPPHSGMNAACSVVLSPCQALQQLPPSRISGQGLSPTLKGQLLCFDLHHHLICQAMTIR